MDEIGQNLAGSSLGTPVPARDALQVPANSLDLYRASLTQILVDILGSDTEIVNRSIQWPNNIYNGDLAIVLPKLRPGAKVPQLALELMEKFPKDHPLFLLPVIDSVHFRVFVKPEALARNLIPSILDRGELYGTSCGIDRIHVQGSVDVKKTVLVEFSSPNIYSEFQGKHLRGTILGAFIGKIYEASGWATIQINYLGDWGKPIALWYVGWKRFGSEDTYQADPVGHLLEVYHKIEEEFLPEQMASRQARDEAAKEGRDEGEAQVKIESGGIFAERNEAFQKLEAGDEELVAFWKRARETIIEDYQRFYDRLGVNFDAYSGESEVDTASMVEVEQMLKDKNISEESAGAWMIDMTKLGARAGHAIIRDRTGSTTYLLRDLAAVFERSRKYSFDKMIYVVASDNSLHFSQMFKILEALDKDLASKLQHVKFSEVSKMASILGKGYKPQSILDRCEAATATLPEIDAEKAEIVGSSKNLATLATSALLLQELSTRSASAHAFDVDATASFKLGSGVDLQYWYARVTSLLSDKTVTAQLSEGDYDSLADDDQANLLRILAQYPEVINATYHSLEPSGIVAFLASVIEQLDVCLDDEEGEVMVDAGFAALLEATKIVMQNGMRLLGVTLISKPPQERADTPVAG